MYLIVHGISEYIPWQTLQIWTWDHWDVYTCIYMVYTCICICKVVHGSIYMYIHVYTMYIHLYALYILGHVYTMYMRVCTFRVLYMSWCTVGVHSTYYSIWHEAMYRVHEGMYTNIPGGKDSRCLSLSLPSPSPLPVAIAVAGRRRRRSGSTDALRPCHS